MSFLKVLLEPTWRLPSKPVPSSQKQYLTSLEGVPIYWLLKYLKRRFLFHIIFPLIGRGKRLRLIEVNHLRILWVNYAAPSLGDSLMDLAPRKLLFNRNLILLTDPKNMRMYIGDSFFKAVYSCPYDVRKAFRENPFDLVICDAYSPRVLIRKILAAPGVPFVGLYEFLNGFEVHRTYFAFARMSELLSLDQIDAPIRPVISPSIQLQDKSLEVDICIGIGGEWSFRTYKHWLPVVSWLTARGYSVSLVGSGNGAKQASDILEKEPCVRSTVGTSSLDQVVSEIAKARVFIGADGGLWHIASAIPIPSVVLFADCQIFDENGRRVTRETKDMICETLYDDAEVSNICCNVVIEAFERLCHRIGLSALNP